MNKLIKLSDQHYVVADDSEIKVDDYYVGWANNYSTEPKQRWVLYNLVSTTNGDTPRKITHSTEPLEYKYGSQKQGFNMGAMSSDIKLVYDLIKPLSLSEVEEAIQGYSFEKMADSLFEKESHHILHPQHQMRECYIKGFKAHQELTKDKLFSVEDIEQAMIEGITIEQFWEKCCKLLLPKTEWECIIDEQGKIKLI